MSENSTTKRGGKKVLLIAAGLCVAVSGAGGLYLAQAMGSLGSDPRADLPRLVMKDGTHVAPPAGDGTKPLADKTQYQITYHPIAESFTSNLQGGSGFAQAQIAVSTFYDEQVVAALVMHDIAVRDVIVMELAETDGLALETVAGKKELATRLRDGINAMLVAKTGFGGIDEVYFTKLVLQ